MGGRGASSGSYRQKADSLLKRVRDERDKIPEVRANGELTGTEKQVRWANDIREDAVRRINDNIKSDADLGMKMTERRRDSALSDTLRSGKKKTPERMAKGRKEFDNYASMQLGAMRERAEQARSAQKAADGHKSASWWIDNRSMIVSALGYKGAV